ncbi:beta-ketoacyl synthase N-terminal-like domain-containing protein [Thiopseudomonas denitrificans]|uniref:3-oxoacyl-[acyl-carrier-protein] synthase-1 n=1 Tax=Thiopseudomonas denitrificans TaxID=1501432 RepID=A0A4R6U2G9_9GAMM|nr:beta-ketoacyl synthase N-terminal-like domain-containing protein [Thiopseudomonas denitrificans]TDQ37304.1 3-oxoacyl-[acyl-carrier-protein] synthase-1 [Thiopseudomonas denitrificans]
MSVWLHHPQLHSCLGEDLASAAQRVIAGQLPQPDTFTVHERDQRLPCLSARPQLTLEQRLHAMLEPIRQATGSLAGHLLIVASSGLDITGFEQLTCERGHFKAEYSTPLHSIASALQHDYGFAASLTLNTACSSAANALIYGARLLPQYQGVVVLAFEPASQLIQQGFAALELTNESGRYQPFHPERDGLILGDASAAVLLSNRQGNSHCRLLGGYSACDTSSVTGTREDGSHILHVSRQALANAGLTSGDIELIKLHGTATRANDDAEAAGSQHWLQQPGPPALCVLKPWLGHNLGACGLTETLLLNACLEQGQLPVHTTDNRQLLLPLATRRRWTPARTRILANFFGFGGNNACLVLESHARKEQP